MTLDQFIDERRSVPFKYLQHDCAHVAADWVLESAGRDPLGDLRADGPVGGGRLLTALRVVRAEGGFESFGNKRFGSPVPALFAQRGDVVLARSGGKVGRVSGYSFGICTGTHVVCPGNDKLEFLPLNSGVAAWRV